jgi:hypothetical protein
LNRINNRESMAIETDLRIFLQTLIIRIAFNF